MDNKQSTADEIKRKLEELLQQASGATAPALGSFGDLQERRAARLSKAEAKLKVELGDDHPAVAVARQAADSATALKASLHTEASRISRRPKVGPREWMVFGRILDTQGQPLPGQRVRVFDRDRKHDDLLGETTTDEFGDFAALYHERDFFEAGEGLPELYVMVSDAAGKELFSSRGSVRFKAGRAE